MTEFIFPVVYSDIVGEVSDNRYRVITNHIQNKTNYDLFNNNINASFKISYYLALFFLNII